MKEKTKQKKRFSTLFIKPSVAIVLLIGMVSFTSCMGSSSSEDEETETRVVLDSYHTSMLNYAAKAIQPVILVEFSRDCAFKDASICGDTTMVRNRYVVFQYFTSKKQGRKNKYIYKAFVQLKDGKNPKEPNSWLWSQIKIENVVTGEQEVFNSSSIENYMNRYNGSTVDINGIKVLINRMGESAVELATEKELKKDDIKIVFAYFRDRGISTIHIYTKRNLKNGQSYVDLIGNNVFDYLGGKNGGIYTYEKW